MPPRRGRVAVIRRSVRTMRAASIRCGKLLMTVLVSTAILAVVLAVGLAPRRAVSLPLYARQTGQPCATCHTAFLELTPFGRRFKLGGYTLGGGDWTGPPFAVMLQAPTFTHTEAGQEGGAAPHFGTNNNFALQQVSLFTGGRFTDNLGAFIQGTYDGVTRRFGWDNTDIRYANSVNIEGHNLLWGVTANNNPTVQDVWNTIPAWHFPFIRSTLAPMPTAKTFIDHGIDTQYQYLGDPHTGPARVGWIQENHNTSASQALGAADKSNHPPRGLNVSASYIYDHTWSFTAGRMSIGGTADAALYG